MQRHVQFSAATVAIVAGLAASSVPLDAHHGRQSTIRRPVPPPPPPEPRFDRVQDAPTLDRLHSRAVAGDAEAQYQLGMHFRFGHHVARELDAAANWFLRAAVQGHRDAQYELGVLYEGQSGGPRDTVEAAAWLRAAAENGHAYAMYRLGDLYSRGRGVLKDQVLACKWYFLAAFRLHGTSRSAMVRFAEDAARALNPADWREALRLAAEWDAAHPE